MELETLKSIIPLIPGMITAGSSVWKGVIKPILQKIGYNITKEQEQEIIELEEKKDIEAFKNRIEGIYKEVSQTAIQQNLTGNHNVGILGDNTGTIDNSTHYHLSTVEDKKDVKKN